VRINSPASHRVSRFLVALLLVAAFLAAIGGALTAGMDTRLVDSGKRFIEEVRTAWAS
jgi:hypothetical protein